MSKFSIPDNDMVKAAINKQKLDTAGLMFNTFLAEMVYDISVEKETEAKTRKK